MNISYFFKNIQNSYTPNAIEFAFMQGYDDDADKESMISLLSYSFKFI